MMQSRLDEDTKVYEKILKLRAINLRTVDEDQELRRLNVIYYVDNSDIRSYWITEKCKK